MATKSTLETKIQELEERIKTEEENLKNAIQNANMQIAQKQGEINGMRQTLNFLMGNEEEVPNAVNTEVEIPNADEV